MYRARAPTSLQGTEGPAQIQCTVGEPRVRPSHTWCAEDLCLAWLLSVFWSVPLVCFGLWEMFLVFRPASDRGVVALTHPQTDVGRVGER